MTLRDPIRAEAEVAAIADPGTDVAGLRREIERLTAEIQRLTATVATERRTLDRELAIARRIQLSLMPTIAPVRPGWEIASGYRAARTIGGDFYDVYGLGPEPEAPDAPIGLAIADVTGKGVTAALLMAFSRAVLRAAAYNADGPLDALRRANRVLATDVRAGLFLTALVGQLDPSNGRLRYASAGHEPPLMVSSGSPAVAELPAGGSMVGLFAEFAGEDQVLDLLPGDVVVWYTDGVTDAREASGVRFGVARLRDVLERCTTVSSTAGLAAEGIVAAIFDAVDAFVAGEPQADDVTLLVIRRSG